MYKIGLKLWSINTDYYLKEAERLYHKGVYDYIELYVVPDTEDTLSAWKKLTIPYIIHNAHFAHGFNLAKSEAKARNAPLIAVASEKEDLPLDLFDYLIKIPDASYSIFPILANLPLQLLAYYIADGLGREVDQPRNLAKSVTVE